MVPLAWRSGRTTSHVSRGCGRFSSACDPREAAIRRGERRPPRGATGGVPGLVALRLDTCDVASLVAAVARPEDGRLLTSADHRRRRVDGVTIGFDATLAQLDGQRHVGGLRSRTSRPLVRSGGGGVHRAQEVSIPCAIELILVSWVPEHGEHCSDRRRPRRTRLGVGDGLGPLQATASKEPSTACGDDPGHPANRHPDERVGRALLLAAEQAAPLRVTRPQNTASPGHRRSVTERIRAATQR
jgi:hypothetical protein